MPTRSRIDPATAAGAAQSLEALQPELLIRLGATAAKAIFGSTFRVTRSRGQLLQSPFGAFAIATVHPSSVLRSPNSADRERNYRALVADLTAARAALSPRGRAGRRTRGGAS